MQNLGGFLAIGVLISLFAIYSIVSNSVMLDRTSQLPDQLQLLAKPKRDLLGANIGLSVGVVLFAIVAMALGGTGSDRAAFNVLAVVGMLAVSALAVTAAGQASVPWEGELGTFSASTALNAVNVGLLAIGAFVYINNTPSF